MVKLVFGHGAIEDGDRVPFGRMTTILDPANIVSGLYIPYKEELYNGIRCANRLWGSRLAKLCVEVARLSLSKIKDQTLPT